MSKSMVGQPEFDKYYAYYGDVFYADMWVSGALAGSPVNFTGNGDTDFSNLAVADTHTRVQAIKRGTVFLNIWMQVVHQMDDAVTSCTATGDNIVAAHKWNKAVAYYAGSLEGTDGAGSGKLMYAQATKRGLNFGTGEAVNAEVFRLFNKGKADLAANECADMRATADAVTAQGFIPLIQGTLLYAWKVVNNPSIKDAAKAASYAAAILGRLHACGPNAAATVYDNLKIGAASTDFDAVKSALEGKYACMQVTCAQIGGLVDGTGGYLSGFAAGCTHKLEHPTAPAVASYGANAGKCSSTSATNRADPALPQGQDQPPRMYKQNSAFPSFPSGTSPAELAVLCDSIPGCLGFQSGPWMSLFGVGMDVAATHGGAMPAGWLGLAGQAGTTTLETTRPNHQYVCYIRSAMPPPPPLTQAQDASRLATGISLALAVPYTIAAVVGVFMKE